MCLTCIDEVHICGSYSLWFVFSSIERSTDQVIKPVNLEALTRWVGHIPEDVLADMKSIAPMLRRLGYDPSANPPKYGKPDAVVINNTDRVHTPHCQNFKETALLSCCRSVHYILRHKTVH